MSQTPRLQTRAKLWLAATALLTLAACASDPVQVVQPRATISNNTGKALASVQYRRCEAGGDWTTLPQSALANGRAIVVDLPEACVDLAAYHADGKVAGRQHGVKREYPFSWTLY